jgi:SsrA-binding protein
MKKNTDTADLAVNKKAFHLFSILDKYEAGIVLQGTEVKACRAHSINFQDAYADFHNGELFIKNLHIGPYKNGTIYNHDPIQPRKLLLHKKEILRIIGKMSQKGLTLVPLSMYVKGSRIKVQIALARGKKEYEKRDDIRKREDRVEMDKAMKRSLLGK